MFEFPKNIFNRAATDAVSKPTNSVATIPNTVQPQEENISFLTPLKIQKILLNTKNYLSWYELLKKYLPLYNIITVEQVARFLSQTCYESSYYLVLKENLYYSTPNRLIQVFPKYINNSNVNLYVKNPKALANHVYCNRMGNGDEKSGDGYKFIGRGVLQTTGRNNYTLLSNYLNKTLDETINYLETNEGALVSALFYWKNNNLNNITDLTLLTKKINGGTHGLAERINLYNKFLAILKSA